MELMLEKATSIDADESGSIDGEECMKLTDGEEAKMC